MRTLCLSSALLAFGCHHVIEPGAALPLPFETGFEAYNGITLVLENGHAETALRRLLSDGIHKLDVDLRDWSARLAIELASELRRRGARVSVTEAALHRTFLAEGSTARSYLASGPVDGDVLTVRITEVKAPDADSGCSPSLSATLACGSRSFSAEFNACTGAKGFSDAFYELKRRIFEDKLFQAWIQEPRKPKE